jgi:hypothetical protein
MLEPAQSARDHQVDDQKKIVRKAQHDPFAETAHVENAQALDGDKRRLGRAQDERIDDAHALENLSANMLVERFAVDGDVGQFGHTVGGNGEIRSCPAC